MQSQEIGEYSADFVRRQDELVTLTRVVNELALLLERMDIQAQLNFPHMRAVARPYVPGYNEDD